MSKKDKKVTTKKVTPEKIVAKAAAVVTELVGVRADAAKVAADLAEARRVMDEFVSNQSEKIRILETEAVRLAKLARKAGR